jgi:hypothetical protein
MLDGIVVFTLMFDKNMRDESTVQVHYMLLYWAIGRRVRRVITNSIQLII